MKEEKKSTVSGGLICGEIGYNDLSAQEKNRITDALRRGVTRREFMTWLMATGVTLASAGSIFTSAKTAMAATPKRGGKLRCASAQHGPSDTLDPAVYNSGIDYTRGRIHYNSLVQYNEKLLPQPELAEEFSSNDALTEWTFKIRKDVVFHDGSKLTRGRCYLDHAAPHGQRFEIRGETTCVECQGVEKGRQPHRQGDPACSGYRLSLGFRNVPV